MNCPLATLKMHPATAEGCGKMHFLSTSQNIHIKGHQQVGDQDPVGFIPVL